MIPQEVIDEWKTVWTQLLDMAYYRKNITSEIRTQKNFPQCLQFYRWSKTEPDFEKLTLKHTWQEYNRELKGGGFVEPEVIPQFERLVVPAVLFDCLGVNSFMKQCFPNCKIVFWED